MTRLESISLGFALAALSWVAWMPASAVLRLPVKGSSQHDWVLEWLRDIAPEAENVLLVGPGTCICNIRSIRNTFEESETAHLTIISSESGRQYLPDGRSPARTVPDTAFDPWPGPGVDLLVTRAGSSRPLLTFSLERTRFDRRLNDVLRR